jgi:hypothetical protein
MPHIIVDAQQAKLIAYTTEHIEIHNIQGRCLGYVAHGFTAEDVAIAQQRRLGRAPRATTKEVLDRLRSQDSR